MDAALLTSPEKFLTRLTISSQRLLILISRDTEVPIEDLTHRQIVEWFEKDSKIQREQGIEAADLNAPRSVLSIAPPVAGTGESRLRSYQGYT